MGRCSDTTGWEGREKSVRGPGYNQSQDQWRKGALTVEQNHLLSGVSFLPDLLQVLAPGSPGRVGHGMWVGATDKLWLREGLLYNQARFCRKSTLEGSKGGN